MAAPPTARPRRSALIGAWRGPSVARAVYGLIVAMSVLAVWSVEHDPDGKEVLETLVATAIIFWLAHTYSAIAEATITAHRRLTRDEVRDVIAHEWPLVEVAILPAIVVALGVAGVFGIHTAIDIALYVCLAELAVTGVATAWATGARGWRLVALGGLSVAFGLAIVGAKTLLH
jgi:hypothetical protein